MHKKKWVYELTKNESRLEIRIIFLTIVSVRFWNNHLISVRQKH